MGTEAAACRACSANACVEAGAPSAPCDWLSSATLTSTSLWSLVVAAKASPRRPVLLLRPVAAFSGVSLRAPPSRARHGCCLPPRRPPTAGMGQWRAPARLAIARCLCRPATVRCWPALQISATGRASSRHRGCRAAESHPRRRQASLAAPREMMRPSMRP